MWFLVKSDSKECFELKSLREIDFNNIGLTRPLRNIVISNQEILPKNCIYTCPCSGGNFYLIEEEPTVRTLQLPGDNGKLVTAKLALPYVVFAVRVTSYVDINVYFRNEPVQSLLDNLYAPCLPNVSEGSCHVCQDERAYSKELTDRELVEEATQRFWSSQFNTDLRTYFDMYQKNEPRLASVLVWEELTRQDPFFILDVRFASVGKIIDILPEWSSKPRVESIHFNNVSDVKLPDGNVIRIGDKVRIRGTDITTEVELITVDSSRFHLVLDNQLKVFDIDEIELVKNEEEELREYELSDGKVIRIGDFAVSPLWFGDRVDKIQSIKVDEELVTVLLCSRWFPIQIEGRRVPQIILEGEEIRNLPGRIKSGSKVIYKRTVKTVDYITLESKSLRVHFTDGSSGRFRDVKTVDLHDLIEINANEVVFEGTYFKVGFDGVKKIYKYSEFWVEDLICEKEDTTFEFSDLVNGDVIEDGICNFKIGDKVMFVRDCNFAEFGRVSDFSVLEERIVVVVEGPELTTYFTLISRRGQRLVYRIPNFVKVVDELDWNGHKLRSGMTIAMRSDSLRIPNFRKTESFEILGFVPKGFLQNDYDIMLVNNGAAVWVVDGNLSDFQYTDGDVVINEDRRFPRKRFIPSRGQRWSLKGGLLTPNVKKCDSMFILKTDTYLESNIIFLH